MTAAKTILCAVTESIRALHPLKKVAAVCQRDFKCRLRPPHGSGRPAHGTPPEYQRGTDP